MKNNKKGFTIVELVIVIAIIAILAAVLIPTFAGIVKKANESSDIQAARNMNIQLAAAKYTDGVNSILDVYAAFEGSGYKVKNYTPLAEGTSYFYDKGYNQILYVDDATGTVIYPDEHKGETSTGRDWFSLNMQIPMKAPAAADYTVSGGAVTANVSTGAEYAYVINEYNTDSTQASLTLTLKSDIDLQGAGAIIEKTKGDVTIQSESGHKYTIKNITANAPSVNSTFNSTGVSAKYAVAAIISNAGDTTGSNGCVKGTVTIKDIKFENLNVKCVDAGNCGILIGYGGNTVTISGVEIKNSSVIGQRAAAALIGNGQSTTISVSDVKLINVKVGYIGGKSALLFGQTSTAAPTLSNIVCENCSVSAYNNPGSYQVIRPYTGGCETFTFSEIGCPAPTSGDSSSKSKDTSVFGNTFDKVVFSVKTFNDNGTVKEYDIYQQNDRALYLGSGAKPATITSAAVTGW